jgi:hypothetical protein
MPKKNAARVKSPSAPLTEDGPLPAVPSAPLTEDAPLPAVESSEAAAPASSAEAAPPPAPGAGVGGVQPTCEGDICTLPSTAGAPANADGAAKVVAVSATSAPAPAVAAAAPAAAAPAAAAPPAAAPPPPPKEEMYLLEPCASTLLRAPCGGEWLLVLALVIFTCGLRFYRLEHPAGITFDELHFGKFVMWGMNQWFYLCVEESLALPRAGAVFRYLSTPHPFYHLAHSPHPAPPPFPPLRFSQ